MVAPKDEGGSARDADPLYTALYTTRESVATATADNKEKSFQTLRATCALQGVVLTRIEDDAGRPMFITSQGAWTRDLHSVDEVDAFIQRLGGPRA